MRNFTTTQKIHFQLEAAKSSAADLEQSETLLNVLRNRTTLEKIEYCEWKALLRLAENSIVEIKDNLCDRLAHIETLLTAEGAEDE
ncbi:hypothetical protein [Testudinibacter sp. TR-2022]|uniref:hypothetical protein n=1 Tax=Testudinibacter sp. TR-2022 TaxID=2585029 RepID=UPI00111AB509|nr:hypothetical protein [Testudinibacter sp. TR-2022]TNH07973.1 hypothetical protein FHQ30_03515 [Pasteurellaceae bacterium Phil11]TNH23189.1 hypothetical protein FHQ27_11735 [Testudinibacter sp. TR-2022]TNH23871.1 hypothetical protein FHQ29_04610 [Testudinibacter sp. TR-2022]